MIISIYSIYFSSICHYLKKNNAFLPSYFKKKSLTPLQNVTSWFWKCLHSLSIISSTSSKASEKLIHILHYRRKKPLLLAPGIFPSNKNQLADEISKIVLPPHYFELLSSMLSTFEDTNPPYNPLCKMNHLNCTLSNSDICTTTQPVLWNVEIILFWVVY